MSREVRLRRRGWRCRLAGLYDTRFVGCRRGTGSGCREACNCSLKGCENLCRGSGRGAGVGAGAGADADALSGATGWDRSGFTCNGDPSGSSLGPVADGSMYGTGYLCGMGGMSRSESLSSSSSSS